VNIGQAYLERSFQIPSIKLFKPRVEHRTPIDGPFKWVVGKYMPIYNDNRMLLGTFADRMLVRDGFLELIRENNIQFDTIIGTSTAGIAPAYSVAERLGVPLVILQEGQAYEPRTNMGVVRSSVDAVASTCPWAIPAGVKLANNLQVGFMYVRPAKKDHGLRQPIEGVPAQGQSVFLVDMYMDHSYGSLARATLEEVGLDVKVMTSANMSETLVPYPLRGKRALVIEDLISFSKSSAGEVATVRSLGAEVSHCLSIYTYELREAAANFEALSPPCKTASISTYGKLLAFAEEKGKIVQQDRIMLEDWRADYLNWGEKNGFPPDCNPFV
jgi:orotate phosphoribosyltransferase